MVNVKVKELQPKRCKLVIDEATPYFVNSLRRVLVSEVPKMAIDDVIVYDNNSGLFDEIVAHRVGLLPVTTDLNLFKFRKECVCEGKGCQNCTIRFTLSKEGPGVVYSRDLQPDNPAYVIADPAIPIVELLKGQRLILEAEAILGVGRDHAKWQVCSGVGYKYYPIVKVNNGQIQNADAVSKSCPVDVFEAHKGELQVVREEACILCNACVEKDRETGGKGVTIKGDETKFLFKFETDGSLKPDVALLKAVEIMKNRLNEFEEKALKLKVMEAEV